MKVYVVEKQVTYYNMKEISGIYETLDEALFEQQRLLGLVYKDITHSPTKDELAYMPIDCAIIYEWEMVKDQRKEIKRLYKEQKKTEINSPQKWI
jgi:hypothetical protein